MSLLSLTLIVVGSILLVGGAAWIYRPAGLIVAGLIFLAAGVDTARDLPPSRNDR